MYWVSPGQENVNNPRRFLALGVRSLLPPHSSRNSTLWSQDNAVVRITCTAHRTSHPAPLKRTTARQTPTPPSPIPSILIVFTKFDGQPAPGDRGRGGSFGDRGTLDYSDGDAGLSARAMSSHFEGEGAWGQGGRGGGMGEVTSWSEPWFSYAKCNHTRRVSWDVRKIGERDKPSRGPSGLRGSPENARRLSGTFKRLGGHENSEGRSQPWHRGSTRKMRLRTRTRHSDTRRAKLGYHRSSKQSTNKWARQFMPMQCEL